MHLSTPESIDYLVIGHITQDLVDGGAMLGGTVSYCSLTAQSLGKKTALISSHPKWLVLRELKNILIHRKTSKHPTTFENIEIPGQKRQQLIHHTASMIGADDIPEDWLSAKIVHLGPVAAEISPRIVDAFPNAFIGLTPQGWMRSWKNDGKVFFRQWPNAQKLLKRADAVVFSIEDLQEDEDLIQEYSQNTRILAITEGKNGARIYWNGDVIHIPAPKVEVVNATGAGDIFAAVFFIRLYETKDPWEAGKQAVKLASHSVKRLGLASVPIDDEIKTTKVEIIKGL